MSKGKDFRASRKRGFDDEGPMMPYDSRPQRPPRPLFGGNTGFVSDTPAASGPPVEAKVKWFKPEKGFGFVELLNGTGDAFLHANGLQAAGYDHVPPGTTLKVLVSQGAKGTQVTRVLEVDTSSASNEVSSSPSSSFGSHRSHDFNAPRQRRAPDLSQAIDISGTVKWFDEGKGFGFVSSGDGGKDVFVHISILRPIGIQSLNEGQSVSMRVVDTPKGREAVSIALA